MTNMNSGNVAWAAETWPHDCWTGLQTLTFTMRLCAYLLSSCHFRTDYTVQSLLFFCTSFLSFIPLIPWKLTTTDHGDWIGHMTEFLSCIISQMADTRPCAGSNTIVANGELRQVIVELSINTVYQFCVKCLKCMRMWQNRLIAMVKLCRF